MIDIYKHEYLIQISKFQENKWNNPPYKPKTDGGDSLLDKTICMGKNYILDME